MDFIRKYRISDSRAALKLADAPLDTNLRLQTGEIFVCVLGDLFIRYRARRFEPITSDLEIFSFGKRKNALAMRVG